MHRNKKQSNNLNLAAIFIGIVVFFVFLSFLFKLFFLIQQSHFDGKHSFNLEVLEDNNKSIIAFSPQDKSISILKIQNSQKINDLKTYLEVPIDGELVLKNQDFNYNQISQSLFKASFSLNKDLENLTIIDTLRLALLARSVSPNSLHQRSILQSNSQVQNANIIQLSFGDPTIKEENKSIEIINATDTFGLGLRLATLISNISGNVILVNSKGLQKNSRIIYYGDQSYTVKRLSTYLNLPVSKSKNRGVADVIIIIGVDSLKDLKF